MCSFYGSLRENETRTSRGWGADRTDTLNFNKLSMEREEMGSETHSQ